MYKLLLKTILFLIISFSPKLLFSQKNCEDQILEAQKLYDEGKYSQAINILEDVKTECNLKGTKKYETYKYLAAANYELDELEIAQKYMELFLKKQPYYEINLNSDPDAFAEHIDYFKKWPLIEIGLSGGKPFNNIIVDKIYPVLDTSLTDYNQEFTTHSSYFFAFDLSINATSLSGFYTGVSYSQQTIAQTIPMFNGIDFNYSEMMKQINIPLSIKFSYPVKKFIPSVFAGGEIIYTLLSEYSYNYSESGVYAPEYEFLIVQRKHSDVSLDLDTERNQIRLGAIAGAQLAYKIGKITFFAKFKYRKEFDYFNNNNNHYTKKDLYITNYYVFPDIKFETYEASIGFTYSFFYRVKFKY